MTILSKKSVRAAAAIVATAAVTTLAAPAAYAADGSTLTEGVGLDGVLELGQSRSSVVQSLSAPQCGSGTVCFLATAGPGGFVEVGFEGDQVAFLAFEGDKAGWSTTAGVTPDSTLDDVARIYSGDTRVNDTTVAVDGQGYAARQINEYLCNDAGCQISDQHLRHYIFAKGDPTFSVNSIEGSIVVSNTSRKATTRNVTIDIYNQSGQRVGGGSISLRIEARSSVSVDPDGYINPEDVAAGTYNYTVSTGGKRSKVTDRGSFKVVGNDEIVYLR